MAYSSCPQARVPRSPGMFEVTFEPLFLIFQMSNRSDTLIFHKAAQTDKYLSPLPPAFVCYYIIITANIFTMFTLS